MNAFADKLFKQLEDQLKFINVEQHNILKKQQLSIDVCEKAIIQLRTYVMRNKFKDSDEEIHFFKKVKPRFISLLTFHVLVFNIEKCRPLTSTKAQISYFEKEQSTLDDYLEKNLDIYTYYRTDSTSHDDKYFLRDKIDIQFAVDEYLHDFDRAFNTTHDRKISRIMANDLLAAYINNELVRLQAIDQPTVGTVVTSNIMWTDSKVALIELIYALHEVGSFNRGTLELKELAQTFEKLFNIELGDFYRTWAEIKLRKEPTKFLDTLKVILENKVKDDHK